LATGGEIVKTLELDDAAAPLAKYADEMQGHLGVLTRGGHPVAALVPIDEDDLATMSLSANLDFLAIIERSRESYRKHGGISSEDLRRELLGEPTE
jgi:antitoxin (DNA-binding transcriptional repressor) of toxin-antitoxin stability system